MGWPKYTEDINDKVENNREHKEQQRVLSTDEITAHIINEKNTNDTVAKEKSLNDKTVSTELNKRKNKKSAPAKTEEDKQLLEKYPTTYENVYSLLKKKKHHLSVEDIEKKFAGSDVNCSAVYDILYNASWIPPKVMNLSHEENVDFKRNVDYTNYIPHSFSFFDKDEYKLICTTWEELYIRFVATLVGEYPAEFGTGMSFLGNKEVDLTVRKEKGNVNVKPLPNTIYFLKVNYSANEMIKKMKAILDICNVDYNGIKIKCIDKHYANIKPSDSSQSSSSNYSTNTSETTPEIISAINKIDTEKKKDALSEKTKYCKDCGKVFKLDAGEREFYRSHNLHEPKRCKACRELRKTKNNL